MSSQYDHAFEDFNDVGEESWAELDRYIEEKSPQKPHEGYRVGGSTASTSKANHDRMFVDPEDSPTKKGSPKADSLLSQKLESMPLDEEDEGFDAPLPPLDLGVKAQTQGDDSEDEVRSIVGRPLGKSETVSSVDSAEAFFLSRASSSTSLNQLARRSPRKRSADTEAVSPSPPKQAKLELEPVPFQLKDVLGEHGSALKCCIIFHDNKLQKVYEQFGVPIGAQWVLTRELQRKTPRISRDDIPKHAAQNLNGPNAIVVPWLVKCFSKRTASKRTLEAMRELDRDFKAFKENESRALGLLKSVSDNGAWDRSTPYYGGQITFPLSVSKTADGTYTLRLDELSKGRSYRFARLLGSAGLLHVSIPKHLLRDSEEADRLREFLAQKFILNGRVYMALPPKDSNSVYLFQTNEDWGRGKKPSHGFWGDGARVSFLSFLSSHNPAECNSNQSFMKWLARFALGFSTSKPVLEFPITCITFIPDVLADGCDPLQKPASEQIMTDGCGFMNRAAAARIMSACDYDRIPTVVQGRVAGAKGTWTLHPTDTDLDAEPKIWIRDSQRKIKFHPNEADARVNRIFDLLRVSHPPQVDGRYELSEQSIMCLWANGVPAERLVQLATDGLTESVRPLLQWKRGDLSLSDMVPLVRAIDQLGSVATSRLRRFAGEQSRMLGLSSVRDHRDKSAPEDELFAETDEMSDDEEDQRDDHRQAVRSGIDHAGAPFSLHERAIELIQAGFHPGESKYLNDKLKSILKATRNVACEKSRISLPPGTAADAFAIPDPSPGRLLKEGQVFFRSSKPFWDPVRQAEVQTVEGPVLIARYPIRLRSDMQEVEAVDIPALHQYTDMLITSVRGKFSLLSVLSGGDYDGDTVIITWLPELLEHFESVPLVPPPENFIENYFERDVKTVQSFVLEELRSKATDAEMQQAFQKELLSGLADSKVGLYSTFHDNAIYNFGYNHENAILMAYMGNTLLDASKSGLRLRQGAFEEHKKLSGKSRPSLHEGSKGKGKADILFQLHDAAWATGDRLLQDFEIRSETHGSNYRKFEDKDKTLLKPYQEAKSRAGSSSLPPAVAALFSAELSWIEQHVDEVWAEYQKKILSLGGPPTVHKNMNKPSLTTGASPEEKNERTVKLLPLQAKYAKLPLGRECCLLGDSACVERIKASYAHSKSELFGFDMAFRVLCSIKAESMPGGAAASARVFDQLKTIPRAAANAMQED